MSLIAERSRRDVNLAEFVHTGAPEVVREVNLPLPREEQHVLRMAIRVEGGGYHLPSELQWIQEMLDEALRHQSAMGANHPFAYVTVRHGFVRSVTDDAWHVDGFSTRVAHAPEQNYVWTSREGTEFAPLEVRMPSDFNALVHNVNDYLARFVSEDRIGQCQPATIYCMDPYILHRRPPATSGSWRTFVRISFVAIEINDTANTQNPLLPRHYDRDGVAHRDTLLPYPDQGESQ